MQVINIKRTKLRPPAQDDREKRDPDLISRLAADFLKRGVMHPLYVKQSGDHHEIITGYTRFLAAEVAGLEELPCVVSQGPVDDAEIAIGKFQENTLRSDYRPREKREMIQTVMRLKKCNKKAVASLLGIEPAEVTKELRIGGLPAKLQDLVDTGELCWTGVYKLARLSDEAAQLELADKYVKGLLKRDSLVDAVDRILQKRNGSVSRNPRLVLTAEGVRLVTSKGVTAIKAFIKRANDAIASWEKTNVEERYLPGHMKG